MSLADAIALITEKSKSGKKRKFGHYDNDSDLDQEVIDKLQKEIEYPNITIYGGDYYGNLLGVRITPPTVNTSSYDETSLSSSTSSTSTSNGKLNPLTATLAKKRGLDIDTIIQYRQDSSKPGLIPVASGQLHAGSVGTITTYGRFVVTGGYQDEAVKLSRRDGLTNKLAEFGTLHRHDSSIAVSALTPSNNGQLLLTGADDGIVYVWNTSNKWDCIGIFNTGAKRLIAIAPHPKVNMALTLSIDNKLMMWNLSPHSFTNVFSTQLHAVKEQWSHQTQMPLTLVFSPSGDRYSVLYPRTVHHYRTSGPHAGSIFSVLRVPLDSVTPGSRPPTWASISYVTDDIIVLGDDKGLLTAYNVVNGDIISVFPKPHKTRVKCVAAIDHAQTVNWLPSITTQSPILTEKTQTNKRQKTTTQSSSSSSTQPLLTSDDSETSHNQYYIASSDVDGTIMLHMLDITDIGTKPYDVSPPAQKKRHETPIINNLDTIDTDGEEDEDKEEDNEDKDEDKKDEITADLVDCHTFHADAIFCSLFDTKTRITCLSIGYPVDTVQSSIPMNLYNTMGSVAAHETRTQYEDATDEIYNKQRKEYAKNRSKEKIDDYKLKVRDYHRAVAGKIKSLAEGDAAKKASANAGGTIQGYGKEKYRALDEQFQKEHAEHQAAKKQIKARATKNAGKKSSAPRSKHVNGGHTSNKPRPPRGKKRF